MKISSPTRQAASKIILYPLNLIASFLDLLFCIPILGRFAKWIWNSILTFIHFIVGIIEFTFWQFGFRPAKKIRIGVIIPTHQEWQKSIDTSAIMAQIKRTQKIFQSTANIQLIPMFPIPKSTEGEHTPEHAAWIREVNISTIKHILDVGCNFPAIRQDLTLAGAQFQYATIKSSNQSSLRRITGYGAPVSIFMVRSIKGFGGCSMGWLTDYITLPFNHARCMAHELSHACNLLHRKDKNNLMYPHSCRPEHLTNWQIGMLRASRHVTFF